MWAGRGRVFGECEQRGRGLWGVLHLGSRALSVAPCIGAGLFLRVPWLLPEGFPLVLGALSL